MSIKVESTTDSAEDVLAAIGGKKSEAKPVETESAAPTKEADAETAEESETSEKPEGEEPELEAEETEEPESDEKKPKRKSGFQRRVEKLSKAKAEAERERDFYREQAMKAQQREEKPEPKKADQTGAPDPKDFDTHADYIRALVKHERDIEKSAEAARAKEESVKQSVQKTQEEFGKRLTAFKDAHEDFDDVLDEVDDVKMPNFVHDAIVESELGPELMYELAKNREELERICSLSPFAAARALGKIEARLGSKPATETQPKKTKAPPPLKPVGAKSAVSTKSPDDMSFQEYKKWRESQK